MLSFHSHSSTVNPGTPPAPPPAVSPTDGTVDPECGYPVCLDNYDTTDPIKFSDSKYDKTPAGTIGPYVFGKDVFYADSQNVAQTFALIKADDQV